MVPLFDALFMRPDRNEAMRSVVFAGFHLPTLGLTVILTKLMVAAKCHFRFRILFFSNHIKKPPVNLGINNIIPHFEKKCKKAKFLLEKHSIFK